MKDYDNTNKLENASKEELEYIEYLNNLYNVPTNNYGDLLYIADPENFNQGLQDFKDIKESDEEWKKENPE